MKITVNRHYISNGPQGPAHPNDRFYDGVISEPDTLEEKLNYLNGEVDYLRKKAIKQEKDSMYRREDLEMLYGSW